MTVAVWGQSLSPGNEQRDFWTAQAVDRLVDLLISATTRDELR